MDFSIGKELSGSGRMIKELLTAFCFDFYFNPNHQTSHNKK